MFGLSAKPPVDAEEFDWLLACTAWLIPVLGGADAIRGQRLILPNDFPDPTTRGHARAIELFGQVRAFAGMAEWPCELVAGEEERSTRIADGFALKHETRGPPLGTFGKSGGGITITYKPSLLQQPENLVATFAHELSHYLLHAQQSLPPGGETLEEHATDLAAVMLGFGCFMANGAKSFRQFQNFGEQGWEMRASGYLSESALVTGLALFVRLTATDPREASAALKDYLRKPFGQALKAIDKRLPDLWSGLASIDLDDWA
jgi:hypothetical protein